MRRFGLNNKGYALKLSHDLFESRGINELHSHLIPAADRHQISIPPPATGGTEKLQISRY